jgi:hypothetical protein
MWVPILVVYVVGIAVTAVTLLRTRMFQQDHVRNMGSILLWPLYWVVFLFLFARNRGR